MAYATPSPPPAWTSSPRSAPVTPSPCGYLSGALRGLPVPARLRHGHLMAAAALTTPGDLAAPPSRAHADRLADLDDASWGTLHLGPGWTADGAVEEVRTP